MTRARPVRATILAAALVFLGVCAGGSKAHEHATGIVGERMKAMQRLADEMKAFGRLIKSERALPKSEALKRARRIEELGRNIPAAFPPGSGKDRHTEAKPAVWERWAEFEAAAGRFEHLAAELVKAAETGDRQTVRTRFVAVSQNCSACHQAFRTRGD